MAQGFTRKELKCQAGMLYLMLCLGIAGVAVSVIGHRHGWFDA